MKKKMLKAGTVLLAMCMMVVACISPASAVSYNRTMTMYVYGEESYGEITLYPIYATACTYCEWEPAGKQVYVYYYYLNTNGDYQWDSNSNYWNTYQYNNDTTLIASTNTHNDVYMNVNAFSMHRVKVDQYAWTYENPDDGSNLLYAQ